MDKEVKEIDLLDLFVQSFIFIKTNFKTLLIFALAGAILGLAYYYFKPKKYSQEIIGYSTITEPQIIKESFLELISPAYRNNLKTKANNEIIASNIEAISKVEISDHNDLIKILFTVKKPISGNALPDILNIHLSNNVYINKSFNLKRANLESIISFIDTEIKAKQSLLDISDKFSGTILLGSEETPTSLFIKKQEYEEQLSFLEPFVITVIGELKNSGPSLIILAFVGAFLSTFVFISIKILQSLNKLTNSRSK